MRRSRKSPRFIPGLVSAAGKEPIFRPGDRIRISARSPIARKMDEIEARGSADPADSMQGRERMTPEMTPRE